MNKQNQNNDEKGLLHCVNALIPLHAIPYCNVSGHFGDWLSYILGIVHVIEKSNMSTRQLN